MNKIILAAGFILAATSAAHAQAGPALAVSKEQVCFQIQNTTPYTAYGMIQTDNFTDPEGRVYPHRSTFRLESKHFAEFCSSGPFFPGRKLMIQLRSLFPIFECRTALTGPLVIRGEKKDGHYKTWVDCLD